MPTLRLSIALFFLGLVACASQPPKVYPEISSNNNYRESYGSIKKYIQTCYPTAKLNANLFTDVPEAELVVDHIPAPLLLAAPGSFESRRELVNIHLYGNGSKTRIITKSDLGVSLVNNALAGNPCQKAK